MKFKKSENCFPNNQCIIVFDQVLIGNISVMFQFAEAERMSYKKSGAGGGTPFKMQKPNELEELALSYLGIEKVYGKLYEYV